MSKLEILEIDEEIESEETSYAKTYKLTSFGIDFPVDALVGRYKTKSIYLPDFQRNYVWKKKQASKFIESLLLGLPVPGIFLYQEDSNKMLIIDGFQRINSLSKYINEKLFNNKKFGLDLSNNEELKNHSYDELDSSSQLKLNNSIIHATIIKAEDPQQDNYTAIYEIFERLNTGGTKLSPQEVRDCVAHGRFVEKIKELSSSSDMEIMLPIDKNRKKDEEIVLRLIALSIDFEDYQGNMKQFLNDFIVKNKDLKNSELEYAVKIFVEMAQYINSLKIENIIRPSGKFSISILDSIWVGLYKNYKTLKGIDHKKVVDGIVSVVSNDKFKKSIETVKTLNKKNVFNRINIAINLLSGIE